VGELRQFLELRKTLRLHIENSNIKKNPGNTNCYFYVDLFCGKDYKNIDLLGRTMKNLPVRSNNNIRTKLLVVIGIFELA
jgi:hypothetical protein